MNKYGLILDTPQEGNYIFGASLPIEILQPDGDWSNYLPVKEFQNLNRIEPYACVIFTILNCVETLIKRKYGEERNYSDRFLATVVDTRNGGCSPHEACEFLRKIGVVPQEVWPFDETINTTDKFFAKLPPKLYELAKDFNNEWDFRHEFVPTKHESITEALKCSPLLISVYAWKSKDGIFYRPKGVIDNHATTMFYERVGEFRRVFDSYDSPHIKDVAWDAVPLTVKRFWIEKRAVVEQKVGIIQKLINALLSLVGIMQKEGITELPTPPVEPPKPRTNRIVEWAKAIEIYEGTALWRNNPGAIRGTDGKFLVFKTYQEGFDHLCDYLRRAATGKHRAYNPEFTLLRFFQTYAPVEDSNNPDLYAQFVAKRLSIAVNTKIKELV